MDRRRGAASRLPLVLSAVLGLLSCKAEKQSPASDFLTVCAESDQRLSELRLFAFSHAQAHFPKRGTRATDAALQAAAYAVLTTPTRTPEDVRVHAAARIAISKPRDAVDLLKREIDRNPSVPSFWNDYAVALFETAVSDEDPQALATALAATDNAIRLAPKLPEARFNRAVILQRLGLRGAAAEAWTRFLEIEPRSAWSDEAHAQLAHMQSPTARELWAQGKPLIDAVKKGDIVEAERIIRIFRQESRTTCEGQILAEWGAASLAGDKRTAETMLSIARVTGEALVRLEEETLLRDAVTAIDEAGRSGAGAAELARAHTMYRSARIHIALRKPSEALAPLAESERLFRRWGSPMSLVARYYSVGATFDSRDATSARSLLDSIEADLRPGYVALGAQLMWERSRIFGRLGRIYEALNLSRQASGIFERLGENGNAARMYMANARALAALGRSRDAWRFQQRIFRIIGDSSPASDLERALHTLALSELADGRLITARTLLDVQLSSLSELPLLQFEARLWRTVISIREREVQEATEQLAALSQAATSIAEKSQRDSALDDLRFVEAMFATETDPRRAVRLLSECITWREETQRFHDLPEVYVQRAIAQQNLGAADAAIQDLHEALMRIERQRLTVMRDDLRDSFFSSAETVCRRLFDAHLQRDDAVAAFEVSERCRARGLVDALSSSVGAPRPLTVEEIRHQLPQRTALIHYTTEDRRSVAFVVTRTRFRQFQLPAIDVATDGRDGLHADSLPSLHAALIAPLEGELHGIDTLVIVPDEHLAGVPFAALQATMRSAPLVSRLRIVLAPNASLYASMIQTPRLPAGTNALVVGDPAFDSKLFEGKERLPGAAEEAHAIAAMYPRAELLTGPDASAERTLNEMKDRDVIHIATHAVISERDSTLSALLMAAERSKSSVIYPSQIAALHLQRAPVVILAGCRTASTGPGRGSIRGFAASFLSAGSRGVIATLWDVGDSQTVAFTRALHRRLRAGRGPADALRETQLELLASADPEMRSPALWGAFQLYGAP